MNLHDYYYFLFKVESFFDSIKAIDGADASDVDMKQKEEDDSSSDEEDDTSEDSEEDEEEETSTSESESAMRHGLMIPVFVCLFVCLCQFYLQ